VELRQSDQLKYIAIRSIFITNGSVLDLNIKFGIVLLIVIIVLNHDIVNNYKFTYILLNYLKLLLVIIIISFIRKQL
jgi:hypothetical protein